MDHAVQTILISYETWIYMEFTQVAKAKLPFFHRSCKNDHVLSIHMEDVLDFFNKMVKWYSLTLQTNDSK